MPAATDTVRVRWLSLDVDPHDLEYWHGRLDPEEAARAERFRFMRDRIAFIAAHALLRGMLSAQTGLPAPAWRYSVARRGKPGLAAPFTACGLRFNISHTHNLVACGMVRGRELGIDVETLQSVPGIDAIACRYFAAEEMKRLRQVPPDRRPSLFLRFWTLKEAFIKATGEGLSRPLDSFAFRLDPLRIGFHAAGSGVTGPERPDRWRPDDWQFATADPVPGAALAVAVHAPRAEPMRVDLRPVLPCTLSAWLRGAGASGVGRSLASGADGV